MAASKKETLLTGPVKAEAAAKGKKKPAKAPVKKAKKTTAKRKKA